MIASLLVLISGLLVTILVILTMIGDRLDRIVQGQRELADLLRARLTR